MVRNLIAISIVTAGLLFTAFMLSAAVFLEMSEPCTEQMAHDGNC